MNKIRVGFSAAGSVASSAFAGFLHSINLSSVGHDNSSRVSLNTHLGKFFVSPSVDKREYIEFLENFLNDECDLYIPFLDQELMICSQLIKQKPELSRKVSLSSDLAIEICNDKLTFKNWAQDLDLTTAPLTSKIPAFIKPRVGSGGKQSLIINNQSILDALVQVDAFHESYLSEKYLDGILISVDSIWDINSHLKGFFCRQRPNNPGVSSLSSLLNIKDVNKEIEDNLKKIGSSLGFYGMCSIQFLHHDSKLYLLEANPRMGGSAYHSHLLGSEVFANYLVMMLGGKFNSAEINIPDPPYGQVARFYIDIAI